MTLKGFIAAHSGLPSFMIDAGPYRLYRQRVLIDKGVGPTIISDPAAPVGKPTEYHVQTAEDNWSELLTRPGIGAAYLLSDAQGRGLVPVRITNGDDTGWDCGAAVYRPANRAAPVVRYSFPPRSTGTLQFSAGPEATGRVRELVARQEPFFLLHDHSVCRIPSCDVPATRLIVPTGDITESRTARIDAAHRAWNMQYTRLPESAASKQIFLTWGDWVRAEDSWENSSYVELAETIGGLS